MAINERRRAMVKRIPVLAAGVLALALHGVGLAALAPSTAQFPVASVHLEENVTDGDMEVVFEIRGGDEGLTSLTVMSPDNRRVVDITAPDVSTLGMRQFRLESPEPRQPEGLLKAYPQGSYSFTGMTAAGNQLTGHASLMHALPGAAALRVPSAAADEVALEGFEVAWTAMDRAAAYLVSIEADGGVGITARVPASTTTFAVPDGFLVPGTEYQVGLGTVAANGNISFVETTFTTVAR